ncbi:MAG: hypothetical protein A3F70_10110 [Acidobacteria bacterium RIFCSPLOWO2_12_FULL_67_14]|nr:MAG: hypothetical protein A3H29_00325 [Acidobacteria bacterium RIFCSPLOWO2_02_FULL_67_21]OFW38103.1 MAG: hypothetical protein A3F70_10110 [Acidobacteria bacterium RIFCSPLOWO2_12_FULL_67_14]
MNTGRIIRTAAVVVAMAFVGNALLGPVTGMAQVQSSRQPTVMQPNRTDVSQPVRDLPVRPSRPVILGSIFERPFKLLPNRRGSPETDVFDGAVQSVGPGVGTPTVLNGTEGIGNANGVLPPDPNGAIGPNHYVQIVNLSYAVYARDPADPQHLTKVYGPVDNSTLWSGFGGPCENNNDGDPIVLYDQLADRWLLSQFALPNFPSGPFYVCIAVSQTGDPLGAYYRYEYTYSQSILNDYPKFGVWPDGYYMTANQFQCVFIFCSWAGQGVVAFEREQMLQGGPARGVGFSLYSMDPNLGGMLPVDLDGQQVPPVGMPAPFVQVDDDDWGYSPDQLQLWEFHVTWKGDLRKTSTFRHVANLPTAAFNSNMCGYVRNCIPMKDGTPVDAISDRLMFRLQYRNFGAHQTLVVNHTVDVDGTDRAGIRWYELRNAGGGWSTYQQGTYAPATDSDHRWMGSIAMNGAGDLALGYSRSSATTYPSVAVTGRLDGDSAGAMTQGESTLVAGSGSQTHSSGRWGDYSAMTVDPRDDCTFWYTQEYYATTSVASWQTIIGSVKLRDCGVLPPTDTESPTVSIAAPAGNSTVSGTVLVAADATDNVGVTSVEFYVDGSPEATVGFPYQWSWDTTQVADGPHGLEAKAYDAAGNSATSDPMSVGVDNSTPAAITLSVSAYKVRGQQKADLTWSRATSSEVNVYRGGAVVATTANDGAYTDNIDQRGGGSYTYKICEAGTSTCSNDAVASF